MILIFESLGFSVLGLVFFILEWVFWLLLMGRLVLYFSDCSDIH